MIKLTNIINEINDELLKKRTHSWQKPDGTFIPVIYSHGSDAFKIGGGKPNEDHIMNLWKKGWQRITNSDYMSYLYAHNEVMKPNDKQKACLIDLAKTLHFQKVEWDDGEGVNILWSIHDVLEEETKSYSGCSMSWLSPDGTFVPNNTMTNDKIRNHISNALDIIPTEVDLTDIEPHEYLFKRGWQRIAKGSRYELHTNNDFMMPNQKQRKELVALAKELDVDYIIYDNGKKVRPDYIIWSRGDVL